MSVAARPPSPPSTLGGHADDVDNKYDEKAIAGVGAHEVVVIDPAVERRVLRKIDSVVLVVFFFLWVFQYEDKLGLSYAAIFGLRTDLHLVGQDYSWASSAFYFGQLISEFPALYFLHKLPIRYFVGATVLAWGGVMMSTAAANNFAGLITVRVWLGFCEGAVAPAFVLLISIWYRKREQPLRLAVAVSGNAFAQIVGALLLHGCGSITGAAIKGFCEDRELKRVDSFRISFLIVGALTIIVGVVFVVVVPVDPGRAWFFTEEERVVAVSRVAQEHASTQHSKFEWPQVWQTLKDPRFYLVFLWSFCICATSVVSFGSIVINGFGFDPFKTVLVGLPGPAIQLITIWSGILALHYFPNQRGVVQTILLLTPTSGVIMMKCLPYEQKWALTVGYWLATANSSVFVVNMSLIASNFKGHTRKSMVSITYFIGYCCGCIVGPQLFLSNESPLYPTAMGTCIGLYVVFIVAQLVYRQLCARENQRRDRLALEGDAAATPRAQTSLDDNSTDIDDLQFRYIL